MKYYPYNWKCLNLPSHGNGGGEFEGGADGVSPSIDDGSCKIALSDTIADILWIDARFSVTISWIGYVPIVIGILNMPSLHQYDDVVTISFN